MGSRTVEAARPPGRLTLHPRYADYLAHCGLTTADALFGLPGEVVCGHPDRHVCVVALQAGNSSRRAYLKREHVAGTRARLKNWLAGAGFVSRAEREAKVLIELEARRLPGPQWLAFGEDSLGRAFLLVAEAPGRADLGSVLSERPELAERLAGPLGELAARFHAAGVTTPELSAKHVLLDPADPDPECATVVDWQSARALAGPAPWPDRLAALAALSASLPPSSATARARLRFLQAYLRGQSGAPPLAECARRAAPASARLAGKSRQRDQLAPAKLRLLWLAGEACCVDARHESAWPRPADGGVAYPRDPRPRSSSALELPGLGRVEVQHFRTRDILGGMRARLRESPYRTPGATAGRVLAQLDRFGLVGPRLVAFGQRLGPNFRSRSFVAYTPAPAGPTLLAAALTAGAAERASLLAGALDYLAALHRAGLRLAPIDTGRPALSVAPGGAAFAADPLALAVLKRRDFRAIRRDYWRLVRWELPPLSATELGLVRSALAAGGRS